MSDYYAIANAIENALHSPAIDANDGRMANVADTLGAIAQAINNLADAVREHGGQPPEPNLAIPQGADR